MKTLDELTHRPFFVRLFNWEYWSFLAVYGWVMPYWIWLAIKSRSFFFFNASNPSIENGGLLNESKKDIHAILPADLYPRTEHFGTGIDVDAVWRTISDRGFLFPLIGKPDIGGKGRGVKKLHDRKELDHYASNAVLDFHIQEYVPFECEVGIFYYRYPGAVKGKVTGVVRKEFLKVCGNGVCNILELLSADRRGIMHVDKIAKLLGDGAQRIPASGEVVTVSPIGNHARGALFLDDSHLVDAALEQRMDMIADEIPDFYFGRLDIRFREWEAFKRGEDFVVIEVNGAGAEPTHMYDPRHNILFAWKEIIRHWDILQRVSRMNHDRGVPYLGFRQGVSVFRREKEISERLTAMPE